MCEKLFVKCFMKIAIALLLKFNRHKVTHCLSTRERKEVNFYRILIFPHHFNTITRTLWHTRAELLPSTENENKRKKKLISIFLFHLKNCPRDKTMERTGNGNKSFENSNFFVILLPCTFRIFPYAPRHYSRLQEEAGSSFRHSFNWNLLTESFETRIKSFRGCDMCVWLFFYSCVSSEIFSGGKETSTLFYQD